MYILIYASRSKYLTANKLQEVYVRRYQESDGIIKFQNTLNHNHTVSEKAYQATLAHV